MNGLNFGGEKARLMTQRAREIGARYGGTNPPPPPKRRPMPEGFRELAERLTIGQLVTHYGTHYGAVTRWAAEAGVTLRRGRSGNPNWTYSGPRRAPIAEHGGFGVYDQAQRHLQRTGPVYRCCEDGAQSVSGAFYCVFGAVMTPDDMLARAIRKGFVA